MKERHRFAAYVTPEQREGIDWLKRLYGFSSNSDFMVGIYDILYALREENKQLRRYVGQIDSYLSAHGEIELLARLHDGIGPPPAERAAELPAVGPL